MPRTTVSPTLLYSTLNAVRQERDLSWRSLAKEIGVSPSLLSRLGNGLKPDADGFATIVAWLKVPAEQFFVEEGNPAAVGPEPDLMAQLAPLLRARKDLTDTDVDYLQRVIAATVDHVRAKER